MMAARYDSKDGFLKNVDLLIPQKKISDVLTIHGFSLTDATQ